MKLGYFQPPSGLQHQMQSGHPECPERLRAIRERLAGMGLLEELVVDTEDTPASRDDLLRVHPESHIAGLEARSPKQGLTALDGDTSLGPHSMAAAFAAAGAATRALDRIIAGELDRAFCAVRPPGHHAERAQAMGFCFFNNVAVAAARALDVHGLERVAILDFDVHHGNGTADIFRDDPRVLFCSTFQSPFYPGRHDRIARDQFVFCPLAEGSGSSIFRGAIDQHWLPALERHQPQLILVSAGFDAHDDDPLAGLRLTTADYRWISTLIAEVANDQCQGRVLSLLEGGYDLPALAAAAGEHVSALLET